MASELFWLIVGMLWWWAIIASLVYASKRAEQGRRAVAVWLMAAVDGVILWLISLFPPIAGWVIVPLLSVIVFPFVRIGGWLGIDVTGMMK